MGTINLDKMFNPKSVAIIGASDEKGSVGYGIVKNFSDSGFNRKVYYINIRKPEILGIKTYQSIEQVPEAVDLAIIATPAKTVPDVMEQCGKANVKGVIIVSAGFKETGPEGKALEDRILTTAKKYGTRVIGPNCIGLITPSASLNATFVDKMPKPGQVAFLSQSGALGSAILDWAINENIGFSTFVSVGSMVDVDFGDLIDYLGSDSKTKSILMYIEGITEARKFMSAARHFSSTKPIIVVKSGKYNESAKAASSHTGALSGEDDVYDAAFKRAGIVRVDEIEDLFNAAEVLGTQPLPAGRRLAIITNAGGPGVMATDELITKKGELAKLDKFTIDRLDKILPPFWSHGNPLDVLGDAKPDRYKVAVEACLDDENVDGIVIILTQQANTEPVETAKAIVEIIKNKTVNKTILASFMGFGPATEANKILNDNKIPTYSTPEQAIKTYMFMYQHKRNLELIYETPEELPVNLALPKRPVMNIFRNVECEDRDILTEEEAKEVLKYYNLPVVKTLVAATPEEAVAHAKEIGFPVVLKILSPQITHKTDAGGVILNLQNEKDVREAYETLIKNAKIYKPDVKIVGVTIQSMVQKEGIELILGAKKDPVFGPVILFGMGGIGVELFKDYSISFPPLNTTLILRMMEETKVYTLLKGYRGSLPVDLSVLDKIILRFTQLIIDFPQIKEIDINPLLMEQNKATILDARIVIDKDAFNKKLDSHENMIMSAYPKKYETLWTMENEEQVILRPIKPEDELLWLEMFQSFSEETIRNSAFEMFKDTPHEIRVRYCNIDYDRELMIIAEKNHSEPKRMMIGACRISIDPDGKSGQLAFIVGDKWQGLGLGTKIVDYVLEIAKENGLEEVYFVTRKDNSKAIALANKMGFVIENQEDNKVKGILNLKEEIIKNPCIEPRPQESPTQIAQPNALTEETTKPT